MLNNIEINVKYFDNEMPELEQSEKGDWVDLYARSAVSVENTEQQIEAGLKGFFQQPWDSDNRVYYKQGEAVIVRLGVAIELPHNKKANIYPRSSLFKGWGLLLTNGVGCIDNIYKGDNDEWLAVFYATRDGFIEKYNRLVQFDVRNRNRLKISKVDSFNNSDRSGYGSSGK